MADKQAAAAMRLQVIAVNLQNKRFGAGLAFLAIGLFFLIDCLLKLPLGTASRMGPGYFPALLAGILCLVGGSVIARELVAGEWTPLRIEPRTFRIAGLILVAPLLFALAIDGLGLVPALVLVTLASSCASPRSKLVTTLLIAVALSVFCVILFVALLGLQIPLFGNVDWQQVKSWI